MAPRGLVQPFGDADDQQPGDWYCLARGGCFAEGPYPGLTLSRHQKPRCLKIPEDLVRHASSATTFLQTIRRGTRGRPGLAAGPSIGTAKSRLTPLLACPLRGPIPSEPTALKRKIDPQVAEAIVLLYTWLSAKGTPTYTGLLRASTLSGSCSQPCGRLGGIATRTRAVARVERDIHNYWLLD